MNRNENKGTVDYFLESLTPKERNKHEESYKDFLVLKKNDYCSYGK